MAVESLERMTEQVETERKKKYRLTEIKNNREEIREMSQTTIGKVVNGEYENGYIHSIYPDFPQCPDWEIVPMTLIEFMNTTYKFLASKITKNMTEVQVKFGDFFTVSIEFGTTDDADKDGTFNPKFVVGPELAYDNDNPDNNLLKQTAPVIEMTDDIITITKTTQTALKSNYGITYSDYIDIIHVMSCYLRVARDFLIANKDTDEWGIRINMAEMFDIQLEKYDVDENTVGIAINSGPGKGFKIPSKSDEESEKEATN